MSLPPLPPTVATPSGREALRRILAYLRLRPTDEVWIATTLGMGGLRVSPCVTATVAGQCRFAATPSARTAAALVIHDYGVPHPDLATLTDRCRRHGWPLIEDAAHAFASVDGSGRRAGTVGDFALYSLPKFFAVPNGGLVAGLPKGMTGDEDPTTVHRWKTFEPETAVVAAQRLANWQTLNAAFAAAGLGAALSLPPGSVPSLYVLRTDRQFAIIRALRAAQVQSGPDVASGYALIPCHQELTTPDLEHIVGVVGKAIRRSGTPRGDGPASGAPARQHLLLAPGGNLTRRAAA